MFAVIKRWLFSKETTSPTPAPVQPVAPAAAKAATVGGGRGLYWPRTRGQHGHAHHPGSSIAMFSHSQPA